MTVSVLWLFIAVPWVSLQYVSLVFPDHTHLLLFVLITIDLRSHKGGVRDKRMNNMQKIDTIQCTITNIIIVWTIYSQFTNDRKLTFY